MSQGFDEVSCTNVTSKKQRRGRSTGAGLLCLQYALIKPGIQTNMETHFYVFKRQRNFDLSDIGTD